MKNLLRIALAAALALPATPPASAHESDPRGVVHATTRGDANHAQGSIVVRGTAQRLVGLLYRLGHWADVFSDVRSVQSKAGATWSVDFARFGHAHEFEVRRLPRGVLLELADKSHGAGRLEYVLEPVDRERSRFVIRMHLHTPPNLDPEQLSELLRSKIKADLADFAAAAKKGS